MNRLHPYNRTYLALSLTLGIAVFSNPLLAGVIAAFIFLFAILSGLSLRRWLWGILPVIMLVASIYAAAVFAGLEPAKIDVRPTVQFALRCYGAYIVASALFHCTNYRDVVRAFEALRAPVLFTTLALSIFRWTDVTLHEARKMNDARLLRGGASAGRQKRLSDVLKMSTALMVRSFGHAERVALAMECRGFDGRLHRARPLTYSIFDFAVILSILAILAGLWVVQHWVV